MSEETRLATPELVAWNEAQRQLIKDVYFKGADDTEVDFAMEVAKQYGFSPFKRQIHFMKRWDGQLKRNVIMSVVGIDGFRAQASRTGEYAGSDDPVFVPDPDLPKLPFKATVTVWRIVKGQRVAFTASAFYAESVQMGYDKEKGVEYVNAMWKKRPFGQLAKCAEAAALRKAFPEHTGGLYTDDEVPDPSEVTHGEAPANRGVLRPADFPTSDRGGEMSGKSSPPVVEADVVNAASGTSGARPPVTASQGSPARSPKADPGDASLPTESEFEAAKRRMFAYVVPDGAPHAGERFGALTKQERGAVIRHRGGSDEFDLHMRAALVSFLETMCGSEANVKEFLAEHPDGDTSLEVMHRDQLIALVEDCNDWLKRPL